jgi:excisionase family DNA binding protein
MSVQVPSEREALLTPREAAARLNVSLSTVRREIAAGELRALHVRHQLRISPDDLRAYLDREGGA